MREILFRGKDIRGNWHIGLLAHIGNAWYISNSAGVPTAYEVIPDTIGQYTDLTDRNGKKIFEQDIVKGTFLGFPLPVENFVLTIGWQKNVAGYKANYFENVEVIGNIHDNPELLKEGAEK